MDYKKELARYQKARQRLEKLLEWCEDAQPAMGYTTEVVKRLADDMEYEVRLAEAALCGVHK